MSTSRILVATLAIMSFAGIARQPVRAYQRDFEAGGGQAPSVTQSPDLWWLNMPGNAYDVGVTLGEYATLTLDNVPAGHPYTWTITAGTDVKWAAPASVPGATYQLIENNAYGNPVTIQAIGLSKDPNDISITVTDGPTQVAKFETEVHTPTTLIALNPIDNALTHETVPPGIGYQTILDYYILDQSGAKTKRVLGYNEQWVIDNTRPDGYQPISVEAAGGVCNWSRTPGGGGLSGAHDAAGFAMLQDTIGSFPEFYNGIPAADYYKPVPVAPTDVKATDKVQYFFGNWFVGNMNPGDGVQVSCASWGKQPLCKWHAYLGHGRHE